MTTSLMRHHYRTRTIKEKQSLLHFVAFFHVASLLSTGVDNEKVLELDNRTSFFIFQPDFNIQISPKNATKHPIA